ncbi:MAG TPA: hypothetical protein PLJ60_15095 [Chryseolinea sp.]|nr:hypothetical protein [Chryseolinea sp.]
MNLCKGIAGSIGVCILCLIASCSNDPKPFNCELTDLVIVLDSKTNATNCATPNGSISVEASEGKEPYTYFLNDQTLGQSTGEFVALLPGIYAVSVKDGNGCIKSVSNVAIVGENFSFSTTLQEDTECLGGNGEASIEIIDGNPPYTFNIGIGPFSDVNSFSGLTSGNHSIGVKDVDGCIVKLTITIPKGNSGTSWISDIKPIVESSCVKSGCHDGNSRPDLSLIANAQKFAAQMKSETKSKNMPREGSLTQNQINLIGCWVDDGALNN